MPQTTSTAATARTNIGAVLDHVLARGALLGSRFTDEVLPGVLTALSAPR